MKEEGEKGMARKKNTKKVEFKPRAFNTIIIEHMACMEINSLILHPPFHLVSNIQWNDKGVSFDGDIEVYSNQEIEKSNFINKVPVQVKGTTIQKTEILKDKIKHSVKKKDIEVYYKHGQGVLFFVVTINPLTYVKQAYYRILAPLELKGLLTQMNQKNNNSISLSFKMLEKGYLETLCKIFIDLVEKQPKHYIEASKDKEFTHYEVTFIDIREGSFDMFEEIAYIYGVTSDNLVMPVEAAKVEELEVSKTEIVSMNGKEIEYSYQIIQTEKRYIVIIEKSLTFDIDKKKKNSRFSLGKLITLGSFLKCLQLINYFQEHNKLPFQSFQATMNLEGKDLFEKIEEEIESYIELIDVCGQIGISENYVFHDDEDLPSLFSTIINIFKNKQYGSLNFHQGKLENTHIYNIKISDYLKLKLLYVNEVFVDFYSKEVLTTIGGLLPKTNLNELLGQNGENLEVVPDNWEDYYKKVSIYISQRIGDMVEDANFNFETIKLSFADEYHDLSVELTINASLPYIDFYDKSREPEYLNFAYELNQRHLAVVPNNDVAKINIYLIQLKQSLELSNEDQADVLDIQEKAVTQNEQIIRFACEVLLKNKVRAQRLFDSLKEEDKEIAITYPIYQFFENME
ncbi:DUF4365 domain-containing protein [Metabacillus idriensis]|uniref:DUF4365 domain-containing protein n=1 Tax=Metabacillus idriensis TaxID=324768 RepID=UPI00203B8B79|nr:DUF4365 domain-containing protein [Metabacillus idriensis]MCM3597201.1 DUF4365 domain-containing protein [Metabacillus idriensis]